MPNYCHNKLIVQGDPEEMKLFKDFIGKNITDDFAMRYLNPIPKDIINDPDASTKWCQENWGCKGDLRDVVVLLNNLDELIIHYLTPWLPNNRFIWYLSSIFSKLIFQLIYFEGVFEYAGILIMYKDEWWDDVPLAFNIVEFVRNDSGKPYSAIPYDRENDLIENYNDIYKSIGIIGGQWEEELKDYDLNANNVSNWDEFIQFMDKIKNELQQNESLAAIGGLTNSKIYNEPDIFQNEKIILPPLAHVEGEGDLPF